MQSTTTTKVLEVKVWKQAVDVSARIPSLSQDERPIEAKTLVYQMSGV